MPRPRASRGARGAAGRARAAARGARVTSDNARRTRGSSGTAAVIRLRTDLGRYRQSTLLLFQPHRLGARRALTPLPVALSLELSPLVRMLVRVLERREGLRRAHVRCLVRVQLEREP